MWSLMKAAVLIGAVAAVLFLLPIGGRTLAERWHAADGAADFASRSWAELRGGAAAEKGARKPGLRAQARAGERGAEAPTGPAPVEGHTEADRKAIDKLLGDHLAGGQKR